MFLKKRVVQQGFDKVREDFSVVHEWLYYFYRFNQHLLDFIREQDETLKRQGSEIAELKFSVDKIPKTREEFKALVDSYYSFDNVMDRLRMIEQKVNLLDYKPSRPQIQQPERVSNIREKVLKKIARSSKDYIKNLVLSLVNKYSKVSALQLREMIVEEQGLCSKSSFYRILEELEHEGMLNIISRGKIKVYLASEDSFPLSEQKNF